MARFRVIRDIGVSSDLPVPQITLDIECSDEVADALEGILPPEWCLERLPEPMVVTDPVCPHGRTWECDECDVQSDLAYDAWREKH